MGGATDGNDGNRFSAGLPKWPQSSGQLFSTMRAARMRQPPGQSRTAARSRQRSWRLHGRPPVRASDTALLQPVSEGPGTVIGPYKLREPIGEGGFGLVFVAEQHIPVRRKVALKIIKPGMDNRDAIARFEAERQTRALMDHPNIAKVFDSGTTDSGRPYFVMELLRGMPITVYCDQRHLSPREWLKLFCFVPRHPGRLLEHHPPRCKADQRAGYAARRQASGEGDQLRRRQGAQQAVHRRHGLHTVRPDARHTAIHEPEQAEMSGLESTLAATSIRWACCCTNC